MLSLTLFTFSMLALPHGIVNRKLKFFIMFVNIVSNVMVLFCKLRLHSQTDGNIMDITEIAFLFAFLLKTGGTGNVTHSVLHRSG